MKKAILFLVVAAMACVVGLWLMAPEPAKASAAVSVKVPAVPALETPPVVLETSAELHLVPSAKPAPKARPAQAKAKPAPVWTCDDPRPVGEGNRGVSLRPSDKPSVRTCGWR